MFQGIVTCADASQQLIRTGSANQAKLLTRTMIESALGLLFFLVDKETRDDKVVAYKFFEIIHTKKYASRASRLAVGELRESFKKTDNEILYDHCLSLLNGDYKDIFDAYRKKKRKPTSWYQMFDGIQNAEDLTDKLEAKELYLLYNNLNSAVHGADALNQIQDTECGQEVRHPVRWCRQTPVVSGLVLDILNASTTVFLQEFLPLKLKDYQEWYKQSIQPKSDLMCSSLERFDIPLYPVKPGE